ncbi:dihydrodipicolinate synthase family protein [Bradyrhizobium sp. ISRA463]|uniref:dihydrodipicolinate synthase family protein n=1 Tax=Bradyrhizobium sp. ISRA463 TaxID=2866199 RepID=UPI0032B0850F
MTKSEIPVYSRLFPVAPTPFTESSELDLEGLRRVLDCMIDHGIDGICILANYSEQFLLSDQERNALVDLCLSHVAGRRPIAHAKTGTSASARNLPGSMTRHRASLKRSRQTW